jgi:hypothetical protein
MGKRKKDRQESKGRNGKRRRRTGRKAKAGIGRQKRVAKKFSTVSFFSLKTLKQSVVFYIHYPYGSETPERREAPTIPRSEVQFFYI